MICIEPWDAFVTAWTVNAVVFGVFAYTSKKRINLQLDLFKTAKVLRLRKKKDLLYVICTPYDHMNPRVRRRFLIHTSSRCR